MYIKSTKNQNIKLTINLTNLTVFMLFMYLKHGKLNTSIYPKIKCNQIYVLFCKKSLSLTEIITPYILSSYFRILVIIFTVFYHSKGKKRTEGSLSILFQRLFRCHSRFEVVVIWYKKVSINILVCNIIEDVGVNWP